MNRTSAAEILVDIFLINLYAGAPRDDEMPDGRGTPQRVSEETPSTTSEPHYPLRHTSHTVATVSYIVCVVHRHCSLSTYNMHIQL